jgi:hypothetical protein
MKVSQSIRPGCDEVSVTTPGACRVSHRFHPGLADQDVLRSATDLADALSTNGWTTREEGSKEAAGRRKCSDSVKAEAVKLLINSGRPAAQIPRHLGADE